MKYIRDKEALYKHFKKDPVLFSYLIGDLDDFYFGNCRWPAALKRNGEIEAVVLIYTGLSTPTVQAFGPGNSFGRFLEELLPELPDRFFCHYQKKDADIFLKAFDSKPLGTHLKMKLVSDGFKEYVNDDPRIERLDFSHKQKLLILYSKSYSDNYFDDRMLETGKYFGYIKDGEIVCVSGVHVHSGEYKISVLGNITTDPEYRGQGIATAATARLVSELYTEGNMLALNVKNDNFAAIKCYNKLGFETVCEYEESIFTRIVKDR